MAALKCYTNTERFNIVMALFWILITSGIATKSNSFELYHRSMTMSSALGKTKNLGKKRTLCRRDPIILSPTWVKQHEGMINNRKNVLPIIAHNQYLNSLADDADIVTGIGVLESLRGGDIGNNW
eukprot:CAMPEP_0184868518 /NCGR_PEP_ID=MMETSP0580-20130426/30716_1 /TAXON_ID=1118495 /ORGANISM="Dactyliosolen fragilissimus" /LENGTH=124 /DNA_ID=CAMNT_0027369465 /DNA_START=98 /DNA_END=469 /DNA_ORIENTATION=+